VRKLFVLMGLMCAFCASASSSLSAGVVFDGYDFEFTCANGKYTKTDAAMAACLTAITLAEYSVGEDVYNAYGEEALKCYIKLFKTTHLVNLKLIEKYYLNHPEKMDDTVILAFKEEKLRVHPVPIKCRKLAVK